MSQTLEQIIALAGRGEIKISDHGYDELAEDAIFVRDIVSALPDAELLEDYIDDVREALRRGDLKAATGLARIFALTPIAV